MVVETGDYHRPVWVFVRVLVGPGFRLPFPESSAWDSLGIWEARARRTGHGPS